MGTTFQGIQISTADPLLGSRDSIPVSDIAGPSGTAGSRSRCRIPRVPRRSRTTTASAASECVVTNVADADESEVESESKSDDDVEGEDAHAISTSSSSDD
jgi:hypothetical protein